VLATNLGGRNPRLLLTQDSNDLLFHKHRSLYRPVLHSGRTLTSDGGFCGGHSSGEFGLLEARDQGYLRVELPNFWELSEMKDYLRDIRSKPDKYAHQAD
jgi:hypothetical protein